MSIARIIPQTTPTVNVTIPSPTLWGLDFARLHDHMWASLGVQVVRLGAARPIEPKAQRYLLLEPNDLTLFKVKEADNNHDALKPTFRVVRVRDARKHGYREMVMADSDDNFIGFKREYKRPIHDLRAILTNDRCAAQLWSISNDAVGIWRQLRRLIPRPRRSACSVAGRQYSLANHGECMQMAHDLVRFWKSPEQGIGSVRKIGRGVWGDSRADVEFGSTVVGPVWIGSGRRIAAGQSVAGPVILWDAPSHRPDPQPFQWDRTTDTTRFDFEAPTPKIKAKTIKGKRAFDIVVSLIALAVTLPFYPVIMFLIWLEDGRPFFFSHERETVGGRTFGCVKFRSMRRDAEQIKARLQRVNKADGPQFYMEDDPRLTRIGRLIRKCNIDELPQFFNVLRGDMSLVGPRPSPYKENQFCPAWREARLSVRPGIAGLWQVMRTRAEGLDFQEWVRYDVEYIEHMSWRQDLWIIYSTALLILLHKRPKSHDSHG
ncbi:MAG: hypothetical protein GC164_02260 [Phycisphaera sp.]|nr:hypothetical protein [Phycisphaera sp.]